MTLSRRDLIKAGCGGAATVLLPNRAVAWTHGSSGGVASPFNLTVTYTPAALAAPQSFRDGVHGLTATAFVSMVNQFNQTTVRSGGTVDGNILGSGTYPNAIFCDVIFATNETLAAAYDADPARSTLGPLNIFHYESGNQWAPTTPQGVPLNSVSTTAVNNLANTMTNLGWNVSPYTFSGTDNKTEAATQVLNMLMAWKFDATYKNLIKTYYYQHLVNASAGKGREVHPAQYGYAGDTWGIFPGDFHAGNPYASYDAIKEWNA
jgi:hypothetical protein